MALGLFLLLLTLALVRNPVLRWYVSRKIIHINERHQCHLKVEGLRFSGLFSVKIFKISLCHAQGDTLLFGKDFKIRPAFWRSGFHPAYIDGQQLKIFLSYRQGKTNWDGFFGAASTQADSSRREPPDLARGANFFSRLLFQYPPASTFLHHFEISASYQGIPLKISSDSLLLSDHTLSAQWTLSDDSTRYVLRMEGWLDRQHHKGEIKIYPENHSSQWLPFLPQAFSTRLTFDTLQLCWAEKPPKKNTYQADLFAKAVQLKIAHPALSDQVVIGSQTQGNLRIRATKNCLDVDTGTYFELNGLRLPFCASLCLSPQPVIQLKIHTGWFPASSLFNALPEGLFYNLQGLKVKGELAYTMNFRWDTHQPDSLWFESHLQSQQFSILSYGPTPLTLINESFVYTAYEKGKPVRSFILGPENPDFTPLDQIPLHLRHAVMTSEDGGFYQHNGFLPDAFREALIANLKAGRFVRGGSTISMQLVKNVFLNRHKILTRKLEEALIVWLIENQRLTSKDRMLEVYLNLIEWGPWVYGIGEASRFYFKKRPSALSLNESIFLAGIIPSPKKFMFYVDSEGHPRPFLQNYFRLMGNKMLAKGYITEEMLGQVDARAVKITGPAQKFLASADSLPADSLQMLLPGAVGL